MSNTSSRNVRLNRSKKPFWLGFDYVVKRKTGLGLINIENRVKLINGSIRFDTRANGRGTTIITEF